MLKASNNIPLSNFSVVQASEASGSTFNPENNSRVRIRVPSNLGFIDPHNSYLQFVLQVVNANYKYTFTNGIGAKSIVRDLKVLLGGKSLEEITNCPVLCKIIHDYGKTLSMKGLDSIQTKSSGDGSALQESSTLGVDGVPVNIAFQLDMSGVLSSRNILPLVAFGDLEIEFTLASGFEVLEQVEGSQLVANQATNTGFKCFAIPNGNFGHVNLLPNDRWNRPGYKHFNDENDCLFALGNRFRLSRSAGGGVLAAVEITGVQKIDGVQCSFAFNADGGGAVTAAIINAAIGAAGAQGIGYQVGDTLTVVQAAGAAAPAPAASGVTVATVNANGGILTVAVTVDGAGYAGGEALTLEADNTPWGYVRLDHAAQAHAADAANVYISLAQGTDGNAAPAGSYQITNVEFVAQIVQPPPQYLEAMTQKLKSQEGLSIDINTFQTFQGALAAGITVNSVDIPTNVSRCKAIMCVPVESAQAKDGTRGSYDLSGSFDGMRSYQWAIGQSQRREPSRPVDVQNMTSTERYPSQEHIRELEKALKNSQVGVRNIREYYNNYVIGRSLSAYGGSENLNLGSARLYLEYTGANPATAKNMITFVNHIKRLTASPAGLMVSV